MTRPPAPPAPPSPLPPTPTPRCCAHLEVHEVHEFLDLGPEHLHRLLVDLHAVWLFVGLYLQPTTRDSQPALTFVTTHNPQPTTHNPQPTTHNPQPTTLDSQPALTLATTHNPQPTTHAWNNPQLRLSRGSGMTQPRLSRGSATAQRRYD